MSKYLDPLMTERGENRFENLMEQVKDVFGSEFNSLNVESNKKYFTAMSSFTKYLSEFSGVSKMSNVGSSHIHGFVEKMQDRGMSDSTLKSYMSGINAFYDMGKEMWDKCKTVIPDNEKLGIEERINGNVERAWSKEELESAKSLAISENRLDVYHAISIAENFGTRIDGTCSLTINQIDKALETNQLHVKEKNGKERDIPVTNGGREALLEAKAWGEIRDINKDRIFCEDKDIGQAKQSVQDWIYNHRDSFQDESRMPSWEAREEFKGTGEIQKGDLCFHGIRHGWACERFSEFIDRGFSEKTAQFKTSELLGHNRHDVTAIYLAKR